MGLVAAGFSGTWGYRRELREAGRIAKTLTWGSLAGGLIGAPLLMSLPPPVFDYVAPVLIIFAILFVVFQPRLNAWVRRRREADGDEPIRHDVSPIPSGHVSPVLFILVFLDRKSTRLNSSHVAISYAVFCLKKKKLKNMCAVTL